MNLLEMLDFNSEKPSVSVIRSSEKSKVIAIGLAKNVLLKEHKTLLPTLLLCIQGRIEFSIHDQVLTLSALEDYEIPINELHKVRGLDEKNIFLLIQEK